MNELSGYLKVRLEFDAIDIPTMGRCNREQFTDYVLEEILFQDHHGAVRFTHGEHPLAATTEQIDALIELLGEWRKKMPSSGDYG